jgi:hypothetical protein
LTLPDSNKEKGQYLYNYRTIEMKNKKIKNLTFGIILVFGISLISFGFLEDDKSGPKPIRPSYKLNDSHESGKQGDAYRLFINNINLPMNRRGIIAAVDIPPNGSNGLFKGDNNFLFSSGFFLSGYSDEQLWVNAVASASLVEDYLTGRSNPGPDDDSQMYVLKAGDPDFGPSWQDWIDAVVLGADFYDGDGDGIYDPSDKNGNGVWDPESSPGAMDGEDRPDLIGDETVWCVYHDGRPQAQRRWNTVPEYGIEVRQTAFAFASAGAIGNIIFFRYRFKYVGLGNPDEADEMTDVYFGVWADPDNGDHVQDLVGSDVSRNVGYTYDNQTDDIWGNQPPCFMIDFFSGPRAFIPGETFIDNDGDSVYTDGVDTPLDTAYSIRGQVMGVKEFPGARNMPVSSFVLYINGDANLDDPDNKEQARNYILGLDRAGIEPDPCTFPYGNPGFAGCESTDRRFWFSGDPVTGTGWINTLNEDVRQMTNTGPFVLKKNEENEIVVAYVVGQGNSPLNSIDVARAIDDGAQEIFDQNFLAPQPPPPVEPILATGENFIDIVWDTPDQISYANQTASWDLRFHQYQVWAFQTNSSADVVSGVQNSQLLTTYQIQNFIKDVYIEDSPVTGTGGKFLLYPESSPENKLDSTIYIDPATGRIRYRIFIDPFTNTPITKGKPYFFSVVSSALNFRALTPYPEKGDSSYYLSWEAFSQAAENVKVVSVIISEIDSYNPNVLVQPANSISGASTGNVGYDVIYKDSLTSSQYEVSFFKDSSSALYQMYWRMQNLTTNTLWVDSSLSFLYGEPAVDVEVTEGFITKVEDAHPTFGAPVYDGTQWFTDFYDPSDDADVDDGTGATYVGRDILQGKGIITFPSRCDIITGDRLRRVELRFGNTGKAYRYINGYLSTFARNTYRYAAQLGPADTVGKGPIGNWDAVNDRANGWVDVPFTAWLVDEQTGNVEQQLAVGYVERARNTVYPNGSPDGVWDPTTDLLANGEIILIFDYPYDPNGGANPFDPNSGGQIQFTGGAFSTPGGEEFVWADITKTSGSAKDAPADATNITDEQRTIFNSPWFNTLYAVGFQRADSNSFYADGDVLVIPVTVYPYTETDVYQFSIEGTTISAEEEQNLWNNLNVVPNPLFGFNEYTGYDPNGAPDDPWVTFTNLPPTNITIRIYSLSGTLVRTITRDGAVDSSPFIRWDLKNDAELRVGSGMYLAIVTSPQYGDKVLKLAVIMPQKQIQRF